MSNPPLSRASDFDPEVLRLFDQYVHGVIDRRGFLAGAARFAAGAGGAAGLLAALNPKFATAQQVRPDDPRLSTRHIEFASPKGYGKARGYLARPSKAEPALPLVLVSHENRGLNPHIEDIARRIALDGFIAFAPADHPRIAVAVTIENVKGGYGGTDAAPIARKILDTWLPTDQQNQRIGTIAAADGAAR